MMKPPVLIYTDGACKGNPGPGGWGVVLKQGHRTKELYGGEPEALIVWPDVPPLVVKN